MKIYLIYVSIFVTSFLLGYISSSKNSFNKFLNLLKIIALGILERIDKSVTGNDGSYSHTKIVNLLWGIGSFCLICLVVMRQITIPNEILMLMAGAMGITGIQAAVNKTKELAFAVKNAVINSDKTVNNGGENVESN